MSFLRIKLNNRRIWIYCFLFFWIIFSWKTIYINSAKRIALFLFSSRLSSFEKHFLFESENYYSLILFCINSISRDNDLTFVNILSDKLPPHSPLWLKGEYYIEKAPFYLYPRKIYRKHGDAPVTTKYIVYFNPQTDRFLLFHNERIIYDSF